MVPGRLITTSDVLHRTPNNSQYTKRFSINVYINGYALWMCMGMAEPMDTHRLICCFNRFVNSSTDDDLCAWMCEYALQCNQCNTSARGMHACKHETWIYSFLRLIRCCCWIDECVECMHASQQACLACANATLTTYIKLTCIFPPTTFPFAEFSTSTSI